MSKFNKSPESTATLSHEGGVLYKSSHEFELYSLVVTELLEDKFYESTDKRTTRLRSLISQCDPEFVMKLAIYAREDMHLRSVPLFVLVTLHVTRPDVSMHKALTRVIQRADEITEALACYDSLKTHGNKSIRPISHQIIKGVSSAFTKFDEYQFGKYNSKKSITLKDALRLTHPKPTSPEQSELYAKIANDSLATPYTWETELSAVGQGLANDTLKQDAKRAKWEELIDSGKLGYMAILRNVRNMLDVSISVQHIEKVAAVLESPEQIAKSKQFPFRFYSAAKSLVHNTNPRASRIVSALDTALRLSAANIEFFAKTDSVLFACDLSGSMQSPLSSKSDMEYIEVGAVLASIAQESVRYYSTVAFASSMRYVQLIPGSPLLNTTVILKDGYKLGGGTDFQQVLEELLRNPGRAGFDKVCVFTDCQINSLGYDVMTLWNKYKKLHPTSKLYVFDLSGYGLKLAPDGNTSVTQVSGWSDKVFDMVNYIENGHAFMEKIMSIEL